MVTINSEDFEDFEDFKFQLNALFQSSSIKEVHIYTFEDCRGFRAELHWGTISIHIPEGNLKDGIEGPSYDLRLKECFWQRGVFTIQITLNKACISHLN